MPGIGALGQTIQVVDKSGKVVSTSRHLFDVFKIGRDAYNSEKQKINSKKPKPATEVSGARRPPPPGRAYTIDDSDSVRSGRSHRSHRQHRSHHGPSGEADGTRSAPSGTRSPAEQIPAGTPFYEAFPEMVPPPRRHSTFHGNPGGQPPQPQWQYAAPPEQQQQFNNPFPGQQQTVPPPPPPPPASKAPTAVVRRSTTNGKTSRSKQVKRPDAPRRSSYSGADLDLAYGDLPPDLLYPGSPSVASTPAQDEAQLRGLVGKANFLLDEAQCLRNSATQTITHLQKHPDAMAAVGLTLAEISNLIKKMGPHVLINLKTIAPAIFGLLAHPHFLVAVGVTAGVTIVAFGGYKIVKRIQERREMQAVGDEGMLPVEDVSRIDTWRRGIADAAATSEGTSVEGEFITPMARNLSRMNLAEEKREHERRGRDRAPKSKAGAKSVVSTRSKRSSSEPPKKKSASGAKSTVSRSTKARPGVQVRERKPKGKETKPSPLRQFLMA